MKPDIKETCKNRKQCHPSYYIFVSKKQYSYFFKNIL